MISDTKSSAFSRSIEDKARIWLGRPRIIEALSGVRAGADMIPFNLHRRIPLVRRPFYQRDLALGQRDEIRMDRDRLSDERDMLIDQRRLEEWSRNVLRTRHRPLEYTSGCATTTELVPVDDATLVDRIISAYQRAHATPLGAPDSFWLSTFSSLKRPLHEALMTGDGQLIGAMLRNPASNALLYGFDKPALGEPDSAAWRELLRVQIYDDLFRISEALGMRCLYNPEADDADPPPDPEMIIRDLDEAFGFTIQFPNPYPKEIGLATSRGVASYRAVQAIYQASRIAEMVRDRPLPRVLEIGAGLGRTAYYAWQFGIRDYTIIDLPITSVAQAYFLGRTLGPTNISLFDETNPAGVRVLPPTAFLEGTDRYDLIVNIDSLPEMAPDTASAYCSAIRARSHSFLSINHEANPIVVRDLCAKIGMPTERRTPYWLRRGYVEEHYRTDTTSAPASK